MAKTITKLGMCQVRSGADSPCQRLAVVQIRGVPFCEPCAHEQEAYFAIGELTEEPQHIRGERLVEMLSQMRRSRLGRGVVDDQEPDAA